MKKKNWLSILIIILNLLFLNNARAQTTCENGIDPPCDEQATFTSVAPDALLLLDFSGSMANNPAGGTNIYGDSTCAGPTYYSSSGSGHTTNCSKASILRRAIASILDYDANKTINSADSTGLNVRMGYMRYINCSADDTGGSYSSGCNKLIRGLGSAYSQIFCGSSTSCSTTTTSCDTSSASECVDNVSPSGGTPLASALKEAKSYLDYSKSVDTAASCRQKFVILITDGADTYACGGNGSDCQSDMYKLRRETVAATKQLADAGYKVFVVGFGSSMPQYLQNTLNWMAYYGGTDNPLVANSGSTTAYNVPLGCTSKTPVTSACCNFTTNPTACYPAGVTSCQTSSSRSSLTSDPECGTVNNFYSNTNDPGLLSLSGYAFLATDTNSMKQALASAINTIKQSVYTFSQASVQAVRTQDESFLYEASFEPVNDDPFWIGHLKKYQIDPITGVISASPLWDAGSVLAAQSSRNVFTLKGGAITAFNTTNILPTDLNLVSTDTTDQAMIVNYMVNGETSPDVTNWRLGDIFHSFPVTVGTPSPYFFDIVDQSQYTCPTPLNPYQKCKAYDVYSQNHVRESSNGQRIIVIGDNDGQLHAFKTSNGNEVWSFIPPDLRNELYLVAHSPHPTAYDTTLLSHIYFMDGFISYSEVWLGTGTGQSKAPGDWHTLLVAGEGRGGNTNLWSQSATCDSNFNATYATTAHTPVYYPNYCGYYAFDLTADTGNPQFKWRIGSHNALSSDAAKHLGQPWSKMIMPRVKINGNEEWVGLIGGGYSGSNCTTTPCDTRGKGFYVIDLATGDVLWSYTSTNNSSMAYDLVANTAAVDTDSDGFVDIVYIGDLGGNIWRFTFCQKSDDASCGTADWAGSMWYNAQGTGGQIFHMDAVAKDTSGNLWVYFGTGNETDPTFVPTDGTTDKFFGIADKNRNSTTPIYYSNLKDITSTTFNTATDLSGYSGWVLRLTTPGEKVLSESTVFQGAIYFTTYVPGSSNPCDTSGTANLYAIDYLTGAGLLSGSARSEVIGTGIPSSPIVSIGTTGIVTVYASTSVTSGNGSATKTLDAGTRPALCPFSPLCPPDLNAGGPKGWLYYWRDERLQ